LDTYIGSEGRLRIKDNLDPEIADETGTVCISSAQEIANINIWEYDSASRQYIPKECKGQRTLVQL
jgi:hypothetical protein